MGSSMSCVFLLVVFVIRWCVLVRLCVMFGVFIICSVVIWKGVVEWVWLVIVELVVL